MKSLIIASLLLVACQPAIEVEDHATKRATATVEPPCTLTTSAGVETATPFVSACRFVLTESFDPSRTTVDVYTARRIAYVSRDVEYVDGRTLVSVSLWNDEANATTDHYDLVITEWRQYP